jgi:hypothetical protein
MMAQSIIIGLDRPIGDINNPTRRGVIATNVFVAHKSNVAHKNNVGLGSAMSGRKGVGRDTS